MYISFSVMFTLLDPQPSCKVSSREEGEGTRKTRGFPVVSLPDAEPASCIDKACAKAGEEKRSGASQRGFDGWQG
jgi:hypothetical protein